MPSQYIQCDDFAEFQEALKQMRKTDDIIVNTINSAVPTDSFHPDAQNSCKSLYNQLHDGHSKRQEIIKKCITYTADKLKQLKEERESDPNFNNQKSKSLRAEQTKLRMLQMELSVEDLVKQRTAKVFNDKCRGFFKWE